MAAHTTPWYDAILEQLADGAWHDREELVLLAAALVPPGKAYRQGERKRTHRLGEDTTRTRGCQDDSIASGARITATEALRGLVRYGRVRRDGDRFQLAQEATV